MRSQGVMIHPHFLLEEREQLGIHGRRFVVFLYDKFSMEMGVNASSKALVSKGRDIENIIPTKDALQQHLLMYMHMFGRIL